MLKASRASGRHATEESSWPGAVEVEGAGSEERADERVDIETVAPYRARIQLVEEKEKGSG